MQPATRYPSPTLLPRRALLGQALAAGLCLAAGASRADGRLTLPFGSQEFLHRWSRDGQHEFTPAADADLSVWNDMLTLNVHARVQDGDALATLANAVLTRYGDNGRVLVTRSVPRTAARPAEHLVVAVLGRPQFLEASFARCLLHDGAGLVAVRSRRVYGQRVGPEMSRWLAAEGSRTEDTLMGWRQLPPRARLDGLPRA